MFSPSTASLRATTVAPNAATPVANLFKSLGQGNGAAPGAFAVLTTILVNVMVAQGHMSYVWVPISGVCVAVLCWLFVDDADLKSIR